LRADRGVNEEMNKRGVLRSCMVFWFVGIWGFCALDWLPQYFTFVASTFHATVLVSSCTTSLFNSLSLFFLNDFCNAISLQEKLVGDEGREGVTDLGK